MGAELTRRESCPHCGAERAPEDRFCRRCGSSTDGREPGSEREAPYLHLFEHASEALAIVEAGNTIFRVNPRFARLAGLDRSEIEGRRSIEQFVTPGPKVRMVTGDGQAQALLGSSVSSFVLAFRRA